MVEGLGSEVLPQPYHCPRPRRRAAAAAVSFVERRASAARPLPVPSQRFETGADADAGAQHLAGDRRLIRPQRVPDAELEAVDAQPIGELVEHLLLRERRLRHTETAERAGGHAGWYGSRASAPDSCGHSKDRRHGRARGWPPSAPRRNRRPC